MESRRAERVGDLLLHEVAGIFQHDIKDPRIGFITFTAARMSPDLSYARVYYTVFGDEAVREQTRRGLESATAFVRREVGRRLRLKAVPELRFLYDESLDKSLKVQEILEDIGHEPEVSDR